MLIIETESINEARKQIEKSNKEGKKIAVLGRGIEFNRIILENKKVSMLILSHENKKDKLKQRDSGLNHILCEIARKNSITFAFDLNELIKQNDKKQKALILARIIQNIKLIKKFKNNFKIINYQNKQQAFSFLLSLGLPTDMAKEAVN